MDDPRIGSKGKALRTSWTAYGTITARQIRSAYMATRNAPVDTVYPIATVTEQYTDDTKEFLFVLGPDTEYEMQIASDGRIR